MKSLKNRMLFFIFVFYCLFKINSNNYLFDFDKENKNINTQK